MISYNGFSSRVREQLEDPQIRTYLNLGLTLLAIILLSVFALRPALLTVYELSLKLTQAKERSLELKNKINLMSQAQTNYQKVSPDIPLVLAALPKEPQIVKTIAILDAGAQRNGLVITKIESGTTPAIATGEAKLRQSATLEVIVEGGLPAIQEYLSEIEKASRLIQTNKVVIQYKDTLYSATIGLSVFFEL